MKRLHANYLITLAGITALLFGSCSKQITALHTSEKLTYSNTLDYTRIRMLHNPLAIKQVGGPEALNSEQLIVKKESQELKTKTQSHASAALKIIEGKVLLVSGFIKKEMKTQVAAIGQLSAHHATASVSGSSGFGVVAAICAVGAICMAIFGVTQMGAIFWYLSVILIVSAVIFFLVFLTAKAVTPAPKITTEKLNDSEKNSAEK